MVVKYNLKRLMLMLEVTFKCI